MKKVIEGRHLLQYMHDKRTLSKVKEATVGIGVLISNKEKQYEVDIAGTGFFVNSAGYIMTAKHVVSSCITLIRNKTSEKNAVELVAMWLRSLSGVNLRLTHTIMQQPPYYVNLRSADEVQKSSIPHGIDLDVAVLRPMDKDIKDIPFLQIKNKDTPQVNLYDEVAMCGYPGGKHSLNVSELLELRLSPIMQFGRISGLLPTDDVDYPYAIQTDIIGTGGSSGSPVIDLNSGEVIAMAQKVLPASVGGTAFFKRKDKPQKPAVEGVILASSKIGLVYGVSHNILHGIPEGIRREKEEGIPYKDPPNISLFRRGSFEAGYKP
jgi:S1-C subfamily serine protease